MVAAASLAIDASPMEGFIAAEVDELLGLKQKNLRSMALLALGYRDVPNDFYVHSKKHRTSAEKLFINV